jgi:hypothetical protein
MVHHALTDTAPEIKAPLRLQPPPQGGAVTVEPATPGLAPSQCRVWASCEVTAGQQSLLAADTGSGQCDVVEPDGEGGTVGAVEVEPSEREAREP